MSRRPFLSLMSADDYHRWVRKYRDRVYTFAHYTLRQREDAEDVTQEVLIRLWNHRAQLEDARTLSWLLKVTRNACFDNLRRQKARTSRVRAAEDQEYLLEAACDRPSPQDRAEASDFSADLESALRRLPESYREILILREIEGMKYDEIAEITGRSLGSVKVYLHRGRKKLRDLLRPHHASPGRRHSACAEDDSLTQTGQGRPTPRASDSPAKREILEVAHAQ
ncbi:MAG: sigma-70 family RNA polymerase sigma factor [Acidobacteriota bacterium]